jgi:hypothetical protein
MTQGSGGGDGVTATNYTITANTVRLIAFEVKAVSGANWLRIASRNSGNLNGTDAWFDLSAGVSGNHTANGTGTPISLTVSRLGADWWTVRVALTYDASSTLASTSCMIVTANGSSTRAAGVYRLRHCTCTATAVPVSIIPTAGSTASITPDNIRRAALDFLPAGSPRLTLPQTWHWRVMLEGNSIGATGHVSGVNARHWDVLGNRYTVYFAGVDREVATLLVDSSGNPFAQSGAGSAADTSNVLVAYALTWTPGGGARIYRNGILIATATVTGAALTAFGADLYFGNLAALTRALSGWISPIFAEFGVARTQSEIAAIPVGSAP